MIPTEVPPSPTDLAQRISIVNQFVGIRLSRIKCIPLPLFISYI